MSEPGTEIVLVGGILHWERGSHRERCLPAYLAHLKTLAIPPRYERHFGFVLDGCPEGAALQVFRMMDAPCSFITTNLWQPDYMAEVRPQRKRLERFEHMAFVRNLLSDLCTQGPYSHLFSVDGDILLHPSTLGVLLGTGRPQASALIQNTPPPEDPWAWNVLSFTVDGMRCTHIEPYAGGGVCDVTGASCLYESDLLRNVRFNADPQGEDIGFGRAARAWAGPTFKAAYVPCGAEHIMVPEQLLPHVQGCPICRSDYPTHILTNPELQGKILPLRRATPT